MFSDEALLKMDKATRDQELERRADEARDNKMLALQSKVQELMNILINLNNEVNYFATKKDLATLKEELLAKIAFKPKEVKKSWEFWK